MIQFISTYNKLLFILFRTIKGEALELMKNIYLFTVLLTIALSIQACSPNLKKETVSSNAVENKKTVTYTLPSSPNTKNNAKTIIGIDSNENGIRDDVEIWIYTKHEHPIERAIFVQIAEAYQKVLVNHSDLKVIVDKEYKSIECETYWSLEAKDLGEAFYISSSRNLTHEIAEVILNTQDRMIAFDDYTLAQEEYENEVRNSFNLKSQCDFNAEVLLQNKHVVINANDIVVEATN